MSIISHGRPPTARYLRSVSHSIASTPSTTHNAYPCTATGPRCQIPLTGPGNEASGMFRDVTPDRDELATWPTAAHSDSNSNHRRRLARAWSGGRWCGAIAPFWAGAGAAVVSAARRPELPPSTGDLLRGQRSSTRHPDYRNGLTPSLRTRRRRPGFAAGPGGSRCVVAALSSPRCRRRVVVAALLSGQRGRCSGLRWPGSRSAEGCRVPESCRAGRGGMPCACRRVGVGGALPGWSRRVGGRVADGCRVPECCRAGRGELPGRARRVSA